MLLLLCMLLPVIRPSAAAEADPWNDPALRRGIEERIEKHRKGDMVLQLRDLDGTALPGVPVNVELKRHHFAFGIGISAFFEDYDAKAKPPKLFLRNPEAPEMDKHYAAMNRLFNHGTVPVYWQLLQSGPGTVDLRPMEEAFRVQKRFGWTLEAHPLYWPVYLNKPRLPEGQNLPATRENRLAYWRKLAEADNGRIEMWNVVNETLRKWGRPEQQGTLDEEVEWAFKHADTIFPDARLSINELTPIAHALPEHGEATNAYHQFITRMLASGCRIDAIGFQFHIGDYAELDPRKLLQVYESFASFQRPLYISEVSMVKSPKRAEAMRNLYRLWFSVPHIESIVCWNWYRSKHYQNKCLVDKNMEPVDGAYAALDKLINEEWHSKSSGKSDADGNFAVRGFHGSYEATATHDGEKRTFQFEIEPGGPHEVEWVWVP
jgi:hypothetical protein